MKKTLYISPVTEICMLDSGLDILATSVFEGGVVNDIVSEDDAIGWETLN